MNDLEKLYLEDEDKYYEICDAELKKNVVANISKVSEMITRMKKCQEDIKAILQDSEMIINNMIQESCSNLGVETMSSEEVNDCNELIDELISDNEYWHSFRYRGADFIQELSVKS